MLKHSDGTGEKGKVGNKYKHAVYVLYVECMYRCI